MSTRKDREMWHRVIAWGVLLTIVAGLAACGGDGGAGEASASPAGVKLNADYDNALPVSSQLAIGTLLLEDTENAVTVEQAGELLTAWQMLQALQSSGTAAQAELDTIANQIQRAMTSEQLAAIKEMQLTPDNMMALVQEQGLGRGFAGNAGGGGGFRPPAGVNPGGGGPGGGFGPGALGGGENLSPEEQEAAMAERTNALAGTAMTGMLVSLLEARAEGESWEAAAPNRELVLQRTLLGAIAAATGLDQQEITTQALDDQSLLEIAEANGADVDEIVAQVVAAETERVNQVVANGTMEQAEADQWLADLETRVNEMLTQPLQSGNRGAPREDSGQP